MPKTILNDKGETVGMLVDDIMFTMTDIFKSPMLHKLYHELLREGDERDNSKETD